MIRTVVASALAALATGVFGLIVACIACLGIAFATRGRADLPGVFHAEFAVVDGAPQLGFLPDAAGITITLAIWTALGALLGWFVARTRSRGRRADG